jgi:hypothetical protein
MLHAYICLFGRRNQNISYIGGLGGISPNFEKGENLEAVVACRRLIEVSFQIFLRTQEIPFQRVYISKLSGGSHRIRDGTHRVFLAPN